MTCLALSCTRWTCSTSTGSLMGMSCRSMFCGRCDSVKDIMPWPKFLGDQLHLFHQSTTNLSNPQAISWKSLFTCTRCIPKFASGRLANGSRWIKLFIIEDLSIVSAVPPSFLPLPILLTLPLPPTPALCVSIPPHTPFGI